MPADALGLRQVLLNLLTNAIDATPAGGHHPRRAPPCCRRASASAPQLELAVADSGHGMSPEEMRRAFEPFYTTKAPGRGTGLGLVIVDHIVRAHGGTIAVESAPGQRHDDARAAAAGGLMTRVLVVDDDAVSCQLLGEVLQRDGAAGVWATDPCDALERVARASRSISPSSTCACRR